MIFHAPYVPRTYMNLQATTTRNPRAPYEAHLCQSCWHGVQKLQQLVEEIAKAGDDRVRVQCVLDHAMKMPRLHVKAKVAENRVMGCTSQARYLSPNQSKVEELAVLLKENQIGVVAHFYMDPEVQGILVAAQKLWPHIHISDSLVMADRAVSMANAGCKHIAVLGVDFMSENVSYVSRPHWVLISGSS